MQIFKAKAVLIKPLPDSKLESATFEIELHAKFYNSQKALEAIERQLCIPGTYQVVIQGPKRETFEVHRTEERIQLDQR